MASIGTNTIRGRREAIVNAHIEAEAVTHDVAATVGAFRHPRYEVPALGDRSRFIVASYDSAAIRLVRFPLAHRLGFRSQCGSRQDR